MKEKHLQKLNDLEEKINKLKGKISKLENKKDKIKHRRIDEVFDDMELNESHLNDLKVSLETIWRETREVISNRFHREKAEEKIEEQAEEKIEEQAEEKIETEKQDQVSASVESLPSDADTHSTETVKKVE